MDKKLVLSGLFVFIFNVNSFSQQVQDNDQTVEILSENDDAETDYTQVSEELERLRRRPVNLNRADMEELMKIPLITPGKALAILHHIQAFGEFMSLAELQVCGFSKEEILAAAPYITLEKSLESHFRDLKKSIRQSDFFLIQTSKFKNLNSLPLVDPVVPMNMSLRARAYKSGHFSAGFSMEKDPGEALWFRGPDFFSAHIYVENMGHLKALALGDFVLQRGQGILIGSGFAATKTSYVMQTRRTTAPIRPYRGVNETAFLRGAAACWQFKRIEITAIRAFTPLDATYSYDSLSAEKRVQSISTDGYHADSAGLANKHNLRRNTMGSWLKYSLKNGYIGGGISDISYSQNMPVPDDLYKQYSFSPTKERYFQLCYSLTWRRFHTFSEWVRQQGNCASAFIAGLTASLGKYAELTTIYRDYSNGFSSPVGSSFGNSQNSERGFYAGFIVHFSHRLFLSHYTDLWKNDWLKYRIWSPSRGIDRFFHLEWNPDKKTKLYGRFRIQDKPFPINDSLVYKTVYLQKITGFRAHLSTSTGKFSTLQLRVENAFSRINNTLSQSSLIFVQYSTRVQIFSVNCRFSIFDAPFYYNRLYAFENQLLYEYGTMSFYGRGTSFFCIIKRKLGKRWTSGFRVASTTKLNPGESVKTKSYSAMLQFSANVHR